MKKFFLINLLLTFCSLGFSKDYLSRNTKVSFFSEAPLENIEAISKSANTILNTESGKVGFKIVMKSFHFKKAVMQKHFNKKYVESDKYPNSSFLGVIKDFSSLDFSTEKEHTVSVSGLLKIHGIGKEITVEGTISKTKDSFHIKAKFPVTVADFKIKIPGNLTKNISKSLDVDVDATLNPL